MDVLDWLLNLEDRGLTGHIVNLGDGAGLTRFGLTSTDDGQYLPATFFTTSTTPAAARTIARVFYNQQFWIPLGLGSIDMPLAASILSCAVDCGKKRAAALLAKASAECPTGQPLINYFLNEWSKYYRSLVTNKQSDARFLDGWLARAAAIYPELPK